MFPGDRGQRRVVRAGKLPCGITRLMPLLAGLLLLVASSNRPHGLQTRAWAQPPAKDGAATGSPADDIDPAAALECYRTVESWLEDWETPQEHALPTGVDGVWVGVRLAGRLMGTGQWLEAPAGAGKSAPGTALTGSARRAMAAASETARGVGDAVERAERESLMRASPFRTLEMQFAGRLRRIRATTSESALQAFRPGIDGLLLRKGDAWHAVFPAQMLAVDQTPDEALLQLLLEADVNPIDFNRQIGDGTLRLWAFETMHLAQARRGEPPEFLQRGSQVLPLSLVDEPALRDAAAEMAAYLTRSSIELRRPEATTKEPAPVQGVRLLGDYQPHLDRHSPPLSTRHDQALAAYALLRYAGTPRLAGGGRVSDLTAARDAAVRFVHGLLAEDPTWVSLESDVTGAAMTVVALRELPPDARTPELAALLARAEAAVRASFESSTGFREGLAPEDRALCALARDQPEPLASAWMSTVPKVHTLLLPWIGWAEIRNAGEKGAVAAEAPLTVLRRQAWHEQADASASNAAHDADVDGALVYREGRTPDWQTAKLAAYLATALGDPRLVPSNDRWTEIARLNRALRFLLQLQVRGLDDYRLRDPDRARGGLRASLWQQRMPPAATAMGLLAVSEFARSLDRIAADLAADPAAAAER